LAIMRTRLHHILTSIFDPMEPHGLLQRLTGRQRVAGGTSRRSRITFQTNLGRKIAGRRQRNRQLD
jgi:hypothetical protein